MANLAAAGLRHSRDPFTHWSSFLPLTTDSAVLTFQRFNAFENPHSQTQFARGRRPGIACPAINQTALAHERDLLVG